MLGRCGEGGIRFFLDGDRSLSLDGLGGGGVIGRSLLFISALGGELNYN